MLCFVVFILPICVVAIVRRRKRRQNFAVPAVVLAVNAPAVLLEGWAWIRISDAVADVNPQDKATILAAGLAESMNTSAYLALLQVPLLLVAYFADRAVRKATRPPPAA